MEQPNEAQQDTIDALGQDTGDLSYIDNDFLETIRQNPVEVAGEEVPASEGDGTGALNAVRGQVPFTSRAMINTLSTGTKMGSADRGRVIGTSTPGPRQAVTVKEAAA